MKGSSRNVLFAKAAAGLALLLSLLAATALAAPRCRADAPGDEPRA
jgi:hypothetical protein